MKLKCEECKIDLDEKNTAFEGRSPDSKENNTGYCLECGNKYC